MPSDSYTIVFEEAEDALSLCFQAQQMLAEHTWPKGLMQEDLLPGLERSDASLQPGGEKQSGDYGGYGGCGCGGYGGYGGYGVHVDYAALDCLGAQA